MASKSYISADDLHNLLHVRTGVRNHPLLLSDVVYFEGTETPETHIQHFLTFFILFLHYISTWKSSVKNSTAYSQTEDIFITLCFRQQIKLDCEQHDTICQIDYTAIGLAVCESCHCCYSCWKYQQFLDLNFNQYLIVHHVLSLSELKVICSTYSNMK